MAIYDLDYACEHLPHLVARAIDGAEILIQREDGKAVQLTPLGSAWEAAPSGNAVHSEKEEPEVLAGDPLPA